MGLFRRHAPQAAPSGLRSADAELMAQLKKQGSDLGKPRHVLHYSYFPIRETAQEAAGAAAARGWAAEVRVPLEQFPGQWCMCAERPDVVLTNDMVRASTAFFETLAATHGGEYDGWEAAAG